MGDPAEVGVTNLGPIPAGMTITDAVRATAPQRKYHIDTARRSSRITLCAMLREIARQAESGSPDLRAITDLTAGAFDAAKRMDGRIKQLKAQLDGRAA